MRMSGDLQDELECLLEGHEDKIPGNTSVAVLAEHMMQSMEAFARSLTKHDEEVADRAEEFILRANDGR